MPTPATFSPLQKILHWITALFVIALIPLGFLMVDRYDTHDFDAITTALYDSHKLMGFLVLWLTLARLGIRLLRGVPAPEAGLSPPLRMAARATHLALYGLLLVVPVLGWIGAAAYDLRDVFGLFSLPAIVPVNKDFAGAILEWHAPAAIILGVLAALHFGAALFHRFVRKDAVLQRMLPRR